MISLHHTLINFVVFDLYCTIVLGYIFVWFPNVYGRSGGTSSYARLPSCACGMTAGTRFRISQVPGNRAASPGHVRSKAETPGSRGVVHSRIPVAIRSNRTDRIPSCSYMPEAGPASTHHQALVGWILVSYRVVDSVELQTAALRLCPQQQHIRLGPPGGGARRP